MDPVIYSESQQRMQKLSRNFGIAALIMSVVLYSFPYAAIGCGCLAILMALLSRGYSDSLAKLAKTGVISGILAICIGIGMFAYSIHTLMTDDEYRENVLEMADEMYGSEYEEMYGQNVSEIFNSLFGGEDNE